MSFRSLNIVWRGAMSLSSIEEDQIFCMIQKERDLYAYNKFVSNSPKYRSNESTLPLIDIRDETNQSRLKICHWTFNMIDHYDLSRKTAFISMNIFDRFMATQGNECTPKFTTLAAATSIYIAMKIHERNELMPSLLARCGRDEFTSFDIEKMECEMVFNISWLLNPPTPTCYLFLMVRLLPNEIFCMLTKHKIYENAKYIAELAVFDNFFVDQYSSTISYTALKFSLDRETLAGRITLTQNESIISRMNDRFGLSLTILVQEKLYEAIRKYQGEDSGLMHLNQNIIYTDNHSPTSTLF